MAASQWFLLLFLSLAAMWDICLFTIPNELTLTAFLIGLGLMPGVAFVARAMLVLLLFVPFSRLRFIGGGDVKLYAVVAAFLGLKGFWMCFIYGAFAAGAMAIISLVRHRDRKGVIPLAASAFAGYAIYLIAA